MHASKRVFKLRYLAIGTLVGAERAVVTGKRCLAGSNSIADCPHGEPDTLGRGREDAEVKSLALGTNDVLVLDACDTVDAGSTYCPVGAIEGRTHVGGGRTCQNLSQEWLEVVKTRTAIRPQ